MSALVLMLLGYCLGKMAERLLGKRDRELENKILADEYRRQQRHNKAAESTTDSAE